MRLGLLADIHEEVELLEKAIQALRASGITKFIVLGDIFETGKRIDETVEVLSKLDSVGVWGNHDFGLCYEVGDSVRSRYSPKVLQYFGSLEPWIEVAGCRFQHIEPFLDSTKLEDLWTNGKQLDVAGSFAATSQPRLFMGHVHRWELNTPVERLRWSGTEPIRLEAGLRYFAAIHAIQQGWCAWFDPEEDVLFPIRVR